MCEHVSVICICKFPASSLSVTFNSVKRAERRERATVTLLQAGRAGLSERKCGQSRSPGMGKRNLAAGCGYGFPVPSRLGTSGTPSTLPDLGAWPRL